MNTIPKIGQRVRYRGYWGELTGTVERIYKAYDPADPDAFEADADYEGGWLVAPFTPDRWSAAVTVDEVPANWPWHPHKTFAPAIANLEPLES